MLYLNVWEIKSNQNYFCLVNKKKKKKVVRKLDTLSENTILYLFIMKDNFISISGST